MARKSKKKQNNLIVAILVVLCFGLFLMFTIAESFVSPDADRIVEFYAENDNVVATGDSRLGTCAIADEDGNSGVITYYDSMSEAMDAMKECKGSLNALKITYGDDVKLRVRGKALYVGTPEALTLFNNVIF